MKRYEILDASKLKVAASLMKWQKDRDKVAAFAKVWSITSRKEPEKAERISARIEIGKNAQVFKVIGTSVEFLGTMNLSMAKAFVSDMEVVE